MGDPAADFAALMSGAAAAAAPGPDDAPYGYTRDRATGVLRPKKVPGRPRARPPSVDELKAAREGDQGPEDSGSQSPPAEDRAPDEKGKHRRPGVPDAPSEAPYTPGQIARGMNRLYRRAGKIVKAFDPVVGEALVEVTRKDEADEDDKLTVGDAWEDLARTNPRIRRVLLRLIRGGAWGQLAAAHAPIVLAVLMKPAVLEHIPFARLIEALAEPGDGQAPSNEGAKQEPGPLAGLQPADMQQILDLASRFAKGFGTNTGTLAPPGTYQEAA